MEGMSLDVKTIAVIGAGAMGLKIAYTAACGGYVTVLEDISWETLEKGIAWVGSALQEAVERREMDDDRRKKALRLISTSSRVEDAIRDADLIVEAVAEEMEMKLELFTIFDKFAKPGAIFASTSLSLSIAEISDATVYRERCVGMCVFDLEAKKELMELVRTRFTSEETVAACREVGRRMGKRIVVVEEPVVE
jgi:3-hydroxybutyryl-CoA dehydrogenase